jgi:prophage regulatory protein
MRDDILERLRFDPGQRTLGQLLQEREAAAYEIERLRSAKERLEARDRMRVSNDRVTPPPAISVEKTTQPAFRAGTLLRIADVCEWLGISRTTVYLLLSKGSFPEPVRLGSRTVRWRVDAIEAWREARAAKPHPRR